MEIINAIGNIFLSQIEWWWFATLLLFGWVWTAKTDGVDTVDDDHINRLQDLKVDTDRVPMLQNILGGSLFGTWAQSDANKGLASVTVDSGSVYPTPGETVTGAISGAVGKVMWMDNDAGNWGAGTGTGDIKLGAVTGTFQDNENLNGTVAGANFATVNGDASVGVSNDPCNNDSTAGWTSDGGLTLTFAAAEYTVVTNAINQRAWLVPSPLMAGKIYKIELDIKDGSVANKGVQGYLFDGVAQYGRTETTGAGWVSVSWVFECATTMAAGSAGFRVVDNLGGGANNIEVRRFSCYEITPCCTAADALAWDGDEWTKDNTLDLYREHWDGGTNTKEGSFYGLRCVPSHADDYINWRYDLYNLDEHLAQFLGRTVIVGLWAKTSVASHFRAHIYEQGGASAATDFHTGGGAWEWLEVPYTFGTTATWLYMQLRLEQPANVDGSTIVYLSQPMLIFGKGADAIIGEGNYSPKPQEVIYTKVPILSLTYDNTTGWSDLAYTDLNIETDSDAKLPKGAKAIIVHSGITDAGSAAAALAHLCLRRDAAFATESYINSVAGKANGIEMHILGRQNCDQYGDVDIHLDASGAGQLDIVHLQYHGVQVT